ncbi:MAG: ribonuclease H-like domain-containing protein [Bacillota bacterium]
MDLRSKLQLYKESANRAALTRPQRGERDIDVIVPGAVLENEHGTCYVIENKYPLSYLYGGCSIGNALGIGEDIVAMLGGAGCKAVRSEKLLYLDTETTGLSGGAGTVAFLVGTGFFENGAFVVRQYFMRDYDEEAAMLRELQQLFAGCGGFVTFNGKAFDINLLQSRFISNRFKPFFKDLPNVDLLYPARRTWGLKLESCRLVSLEENILGETRIGDIPGELIPAVYFKYLDDRDATEIRRVVKHNEQDILSMVSLLCKLAAMVGSPISETDGCLELLGVSRLFEANGRIDDMLECLEALTASEHFNVRMHAVKRLTRVYKRNGRYDRALEHWKAVEAENPGFECFHLVELAKYYEHKVRDYNMALRATNKAMESCIRAGFAGGRQLEELKRRKARLIKKLGRSGAMGCES